MNNVSDDATGVKTEIKRLHEVARANDRLIADLLDALSICETYLQAVIDGDVPDGELYILNLARAAIAKAEGR